MNKNRLRHPYSAYAKVAALLVMVIGLVIGGGHGNAALHAGQTPSGQLRTNTQEPSARADSAVHPRIAIIIDDFGNGMRGTDEMFALPIKLTVAVMPFLSTSEADARRAHERGFDVLVHLPMEPRKGKPEWLGPGAVLSSLSDQEIRKRVEAAVDHVPFAVGINNHMGSKVTGDERVMRAVLSVCKERGLFFVDSHTNYRSVVGQVAEQMGLPRVENHIFLDDTHTASHVTRQLQRAGKWALDHKYCVTIGHVGIKGKETAAGIRSGIDNLKNRVQFVGISDLVKDEWKWNSRLIFP
ncbi:divergent polysaccharide deacetylase family protein [Paenibacillus zanthoxyli]|uniref:divergent polysaccharide deacetylase family protein n=1 Tax=Paenibacillus zanthoxyli TaxID=369399 RepID=UPI00046EEE93|nr:divergent polysaccharide deacetylase family protein [Paenibacillus zanthoxyli]